MGWPQAVFWLILVAVSAGAGCRWYSLRQMSQALEQLQDRYEPIVQLSNQLFYDYDVTSGQIAWAGAILSMTGYQPWEFQSTDIDAWAGMIHPDDLDDALRLLEEAHSEVSNYRVEYRFRGKSGDYTHVEDEGRFFADQHGRPVRMLGTMKDISVRKEAERQLQEADSALRKLNSELEQRVRQRTQELTRANQELARSEEQFRSIFEFVSIGMCLISTDGRYLMVNRSLCAMLGYSESELLSKSYQEVSEPEDAHLTSEQMLRLLNDEDETEAYEKRYRHKSGRTVWALTGICLQRDGEGRPSHFICHLEDITRRKRDQAQLQRLHAAIEQTGDGIAITSPLGVIEYVNPAFGRITGYVPSETLGRTPRFLDSGQYHPDFYQEILDTLATGQIWSGQVTNRKKSGSLMTADASIAPIHALKGQNIGYVAVIRDVTEKQALENRLKQAQKMEAIGTLAGGIAHDFNNILGGIIGCSEMALLEIPPASPACLDLEKILEAGLRAKSLIKQILTFSRQGECEMAPIDLSSVLKETVKLFRASCPPDIKVRLNAPNGMKAVMADPIQMQQVLMNLCANARYAMREQGGTLEVTLAEVHFDVNDSEGPAAVSPGAYLELAVSDTGCGIPPEIVERIFDPFFTTKPVGEGTGLGLSVVHGIVKKHGGSITVDPGAGAGVTFRVLVPMLDHSIAAETGDDLLPLPRGSERILVAEDEQLLLSVMPRMLTDLGYETVAAASGAEAYATFTSQPQAFDLVLTDHAMADMTGVELARRIIAIRPDLPIVLCSGYSQPVSAELAATIGIQAVLQKPLDRAQVAGAIRRALDKRLSGVDGREWKGVACG